MALRTTDGMYPTMSKRQRRLVIKFTKREHREIIRARIPTWAFKILNVVFISFIQSILLFLLAAPAYPILLSTQFRPEVGLSDVTFVVLELGLVIIEWFADQQQWSMSNQTAMPFFIIIRAWSANEKQTTKMPNMPTERQPNFPQVGLQMT